MVSAIYVELFAKGKDLVFKQLALRWQIAKQLSGLNLLSLNKEN